MTLAAGAEQLEFLSTSDVIDHVLAENAGPACITCSFQAEDMIVLHLVRQRVPDIPVVFLDTGYHFAETYAYRDRITKLWDLNLVNVVPTQSVGEQESALGMLYRSDPSRCCHLRSPLMPDFAGSWR